MFNGIFWKLLRSYRDKLIKLYFKFNNEENEIFLSLSDNFLLSLIISAQKTRKGKILAKGKNSRKNFTQESLEWNGRWSI